MNKHNTIQECWEEFNETLPDGAKGEEENEFIKTVFYSGAGAFNRTLIEAADDNISEDAYAAIWDGISNEILDFMAALLKKRGIDLPDPPDNEMSS